METIEINGKKYYDNQRNRRIEGKIKDRVFAVDLNPECIGYSILDKTDNGVKVIACGLISFSKLMAKTGKRSNSKENKYRNNKHKYEVTIAVKYIFGLIKHYRCSGLVIEELSFSTDGDKVGSVEANRKTRNIWYRGLLEGCIVRRCNESGVELIKVNPCYSSFIGNICYGYVDATNASIEIGRRWLEKYEKGRFYPDIRDVDIYTLETKFGDVVKYSTVCNWVKIYKSLVQRYNGVEFAQRLMAGIEEVEMPWRYFSIKSYRSMVADIRFNTL